MTISFRSIFAATILAGTALTAAPALAQDSDITVSANVALTTDYRFRGVSFSGGDFAVQGGVDVGHSSGFYVGTWASSLEEDGGYGSTEVDIYGGWSGALTDTVSVDVGLLYYMYPNSGAGDFDYLEPYASVTGAVGPAEVTVGVAYAFDQNSLDFGADGGTDDNLYIYGDLGFGIPETPVSFSAHLGYTDGALSYDYDDTSFDWSVGASVGFKGLELGVAYVGVEGPDSYPYRTDDTVVATLSASF
ncbi:TorF family putative porin [Croceicoccus bisphenolivorans]|uniref:TorF family putative porin n=1 Tax=Croceicoccus bisphenolivorans TaxID=1783232 RepID=UPI00083175C8|nr:TorF family putative porin [Croceicoccus bisphenolivorans]